MSRLPIVLSSCALALGAAADSASLPDWVVYQNDFSQRLSEQEVPSASWLVSAPYREGNLMRNYANWDNEVVPYSDKTTIQDGWAKGNDGNHTDEADFKVIVAGGNQYAAFVNGGTLVDPSKDHNTRALHPFYNSFTSGHLRMQVDLRGPSSYQKDSNNNFFVGPYFRKYMDPNWGTGGVPARPGMFGFNQKRAYIYGGNGQGVFEGKYVENATAGHWYRFVVDFDLDAQTLGGSVYDLGTDMPTHETTGTFWKTLPTLHFHTDFSAANGPIEGFCLADAGSVSGRGADFDPLKASSVDNILCWWNKDGTSFTDADLFYENDFSTRRVRTLKTENADRTSFACEAPAGVTTNVFTSYPKNDWTMKGVTNYQLTATAKSGKVAQPYGIDGWRRLNSDGKSLFSLCNPGGTGATRMVVSSADSGRFGLIATPIGENITSGDVRLTFDIRTPNKWKDSSRWVWAMLAGDDYLNSSTDTQQADLYYARLGVRGTSNSDFRFSCRGTGDVEDGDAAKKNVYYRGIMTVHLDSNTFDAEMYEMGTASAAATNALPAAAAFSVTGQTIHNNGKSTGVSCLAFYAAGVGGWNSAGRVGDEFVFIDNLQVDKKASDATDWQKVYYNDFDTRIRYTQHRPYPLLVSPVGRFGEDGWVKRNNALCPLLITPEDNPALYGTDVYTKDGIRLESNASYVWTVQQLGKQIRNGKMTVQVDMRPPRFWTEDLKGSAAGTLILGGDRYYQVEQANDQFLKDYQIRFGFACPEFVRNNFGRYEKVAVYYRDAGGAKTLGETVDTTHWYRFIATTCPADGTYDLDIYDLGTTHPTFATATPSEKFASLKDVTYNGALAKDEGISCWGVTVQSVQNDRAWEADDPGLMLIDNLRVTHKMSGLSLFVR